MPKIYNNLEKAITGLDDFKRIISITAEAYNNMIFEHLGILPREANKDENAMARREQELIVQRMQKGTPAAAGAAPAADIRTQVEKSGQAYDPAKYDYRVAPDGSIQRKAK